MNAIIFLTVICCGYYIFNKYFEEHVEERYHYYFGGFVGVYCVLLYLYHFEYPFVYQLLKNIYETNNQPLYNFNAQVSNAELFQAQNPNFNIKETLLQKQGGRCYACSNFLMKEDIHKFMKTVDIFIQDFLQQQKGLDQINNSFQLELKTLQQNISTIENMISFLQKLPDNHKEEQIMENIA